MAEYDFAWRWLAHGAVGGLIVLMCGSLAARLCRQPVRRGRIVVFTLVGACAVPWLGLLPGGPRWSAGVILPTPTVNALALADLPADPPAAAMELPSLPAATERDAGCARRRPQGRKCRVSANSASLERDRDFPLRRDLGRISRVVALRPVSALADRPRGKVGVG
jgi:hypothetical protein